MQDGQSGGSAVVAELREIATAQVEEQEREAWLDGEGRAYPEEEARPRMLLLRLGRLLRAPEGEDHTEAATHARTVWAQALYPLRTPADIAAALRLVEDVVRDLRPLIGAVVFRQPLDAAYDARASLLALMDTIRERAPEHLQ